MNPPASTSDSEMLCLSCGLCCNGTLHNWTRLRPPEVPGAAARGLRTFRRRDGSPAFRQPCGAFQEPACSIYNQRPQACQEYVCPLLSKLQAGEISLSQALQLTRTARQLIEALRARMPDPDPDLPLDWQVRLNWRADQPLPDEAQAAFEPLAALLKMHWRVTWRRKSARRRRGAAQSTSR